MRKFFPASFLAFVLAVSILVPVSNTFAFSDSGNLRVNIVPVTATTKQTSNYSYICPTVALAKLSFFARLLAAVGIARPLSTQNLAESTGCGDPGVVTKAINANWSCTPKIPGITDYSGKSFFECINENYSKSNKKTFSAKRAETYGITSCTETHVYANGIGTVTNSCAGPKALPPSITKVTYPPEVDVTGIGSFRGRWLVGTNLVEDFVVTESVQTTLALWDITGVQWVETDIRVSIGVALVQLRLNTKTNEFDYVPVPCTKITVAGQALDKNCRTTLWVAEKQPVDVTPTAPAPYYIYSVFVSGAITTQK